MTTAQFNVKMIPPPKVTAPPGLEIWYENSKEIAARLQTEEDRFHFYHVDQICEAMYYQGAGPADVEEFLRMNTAGLKNAVELGNPFRLKCPDPVLMAQRAIKTNLTGYFVPDTVEKVEKTIVWDPDRAEEVEQARLTFTELAQRNNRQKVKFDESTGSVTIKDRTITKHERVYLSIVDVYKDAVQLQRFLEEKGIRVLGEITSI
jgi:hypothetical protein